MKWYVLASLLALQINAYGESYTLCDPSFTDDFIEKVQEGEVEYPEKAKYSFGEAGEYGFTINGKDIKNAKVKEISGEEWAYLVTVLINKRPPVGKSYKFLYRGEGASCNDGYGKLEVRNVGGFAGGVLLEKMNCVCAVD